MTWAFPLGLSLYLLLDKRGGTALTPAVGLTSATTYLLLLFGSFGFKHIVPEDAVGCSCGTKWSWACNVTGSVNKVAQLHAEASR